MIQTNSRALLTVGRAVGVLLAAEAATFLLAALTHLGVGIPLGFGVLREPRIIDATVVEGLVRAVVGDRRLRGPNPPSLGVAGGDRSP
jgi:hypothetical protein